MKNQWTLIWVFFLLGMASWYSVRAQGAGVQFSVEAPDEVQTGIPFQVAFVLNQEADHFEGPDFKNLTVLGGPGYAESRYTSFVNGKRTSELKITYTYALKSDKPGRFDIGPALARIGRTTYKTKSFTITVTGSIQPGAPQPEDKGSGGGDIFIRTLVSNDKPFKGEVVVLTYKLYTRLAINNIERIKLPSYNGCWSESIETGKYNIVQEQYQGKPYNTLILNRTLIIPQRPGKIMIEPAAVSIQRVVERTINRQLWVGVMQQRVRELVDNEIRSSSVTLDVKSLPTSGEPVGFSGSVGVFTLSASLSGEKVMAGEPAELTVIITGSGNIKLLEKPEVQVPETLELFDPEITGDIAVTASGMSGTREYSYLIIPRDSGRYIIPGIKFSYFDPSTKRYVQRTTDQQILMVAPNTKGIQFSTPNMVKEDIRYFGKDVRYIAPIYTLPWGKGLTPGSWLHLMAIIIPLVILVLLLIVYRKRIRMHADKEKMRALKAKKVADSRLKMAARAMEKHDVNHFFEAMLDALWGYASDKLNIPVAELNRNHVKEYMIRKGVEEEVIDQFIDVIDQCEFSRYAPPAEAYAIEKYYVTAEQSLTALEKKIQSVIIKEGK